MCVGVFDPAASMDAARIVQLALGNAQKLVDLLRSHRKLSGDLKKGLDIIRLELKMIQSDIQKFEPLQLQLQELAYDSDDFINGLWIPGPCASFILHSVGLDPGSQDIQSIAAFGEKIKILRERLSSEPSTTQQSGATAPDQSPSAGSPPCYAPEEDLVGITRPKRDILELLLPTPAELKVISIVGCSGLGKTALARALYDDSAVTGEFSRTAWVVASGRCPADILKDIVQQFGLAAAGGRSPTEALGGIPDKERCLIFIDDVQRHGIPWGSIEEAFHGNSVGSRIIVTTCVPSVASFCSSGSYLYPMQHLDQRNSRNLLRKEVRRYQTTRAHSLEDDEDQSIIDLCSGLPSALISAADYLCKIGPYLTREDCERVAQVLGDRLAGKESAFEETRRALVQCYNSLPDHGHRGSFLYVSIFPRDHPIKITSLVRRLIAEGIVPGNASIMKGQELVATDVRECLEKLIDQGMIEPVSIDRNQSKVAKRCKVNSIILEFTIHMSVSRNFLSLIRQDNALLNRDGRVRRLSVQSSPRVGCSGLTEEIGLSAVRSLTLSNSGILDFKRCKMMRVLDLEGCTGLNDKVVDGICGLLFLTYLSLRNTDIHELPRDVKKLLLLQTLDIRETEVNKLPVVVVMLPQLAYLFGRFELTDVPKKTTRLVQFFSKNSKLHTLSDIIIDRTKGSEIEKIIMQHARSLKKVKVWCKDTTRHQSKRPATSGVEIIRNFARIGIGIGRTPSGSANPSSSTLQPAPATCAPLGSPEPSTSTTSSLGGILASSLNLESLSIDSDDLCNGFLGSVQASCTISSMKLRGKLQRLPQPDTLRELSNLSRLHLSLTGLSSEALACLQNLKRLKYLKLEEGLYGFRGSDFVVDAHGFPRLLELCFQASKHHPRVWIHEGAMTRLASLQLLCPEYPPRSGNAAEIDSPIGVEGFLNLGELNEVVLHHSATDDTLEDWEVAATVHPKRPHVHKQAA